MYSITLEDGSVLNNLELNGNCYVSDEIISESIFSGNLGTIEITDGIEAETYHDMVLHRLWIDGNQTWIALGEISKEEKESESLEATITDLQLALTEIYESLIGGA